MDQTPKKTRFDYTIAVVCPMHFEMTSFRAMMDREHAKLDAEPGDKNMYVFGEVHGQNTVLAWHPDTQGKSAASNVMTNLSRSFPLIEWKFLVGIGGGNVSDEHDIRLGDVVVGTPEGDTGGVAQYDLGRATETGFVLKGFIWPSKALVRSAIVLMRSDHDIHGSKLTANVAAMCRRLRNKKKYARPDKKDVPHETSSYTLSQRQLSVRENTPPIEITRPPRDSTDPEIHYGLIASGDTLVTSSAERRKINERLGGKVLCFEMEAAGLMNEESCLVIRGIADFADPHKNDDWKCYAAANASACAKEIISYLKSQDVTGSKNDTQSSSSTWNSFSGRGIQSTSGGEVAAGKDINIS